jgi:hypothetical protein
MPKNRRIKVMIEEIRRRGGMVGISDELSDEEAELFLREVLHCPDCMEEARRAGTLTPPRRSTEH